MWVLGPFLRAKLHFAKVTQGADGVNGAIQRIRQILVAHKQHLEVSPWRGLPELTNKNGSPCHHSCPTQAWSMGCLLEVLYDIENIQSE